MNTDRIFTQQKYRNRYTDYYRNPKNVGICVGRYLTRGLAQGVIEKMKMKRVNSDNLFFFLAVVVCTLNPPSLSQRIVRLWLHRNGSAWCRVAAAASALARCGSTATRLAEQQHIRAQFAQIFGANLRILRLLLLSDAVSFMRYHSWDWPVRCLRTRMVPSNLQLTHTR